MTIQLKVWPWDARKPDKVFGAYYYGFDNTGCAAADLILKAVAWAGQQCHSTDGWTDGDPSPADLIQEAANAAAREIERLTAKLAECLAVLKEREFNLVNGAPRDDYCCIDCLSQTKGEHKLYCDWHRAMTDEEPKQ